MRELVDVAALVTLTQALVAVDTQNPPGNEVALLDVARGMLEPFGARFEQVEPEPGRASLVATVGATTAAGPPSSSTGTSTWCP